MTGSADPYFVDTPQGIFTAAGHWYRARLVDLQTFAGEVIERESLDTVLRRSDEWIDAPRTLGLWLLLLLLPWFPVEFAAPIWLVALLAVRVAAPSGGGVVVGRVLRVLSRVPLQFVAYVVVLSGLAAVGAGPRVVLGLVGFVLLRWGLLTRVVDRLLAPALRRLYPLGVPDQTLRAVLTKSALRHGIDLPMIREMEDRLYRQVIDSAGGRIAQGKSPRKRRDS